MMPFPGKVPGKTDALRIGSVEVFLHNYTPHHLRNKEDGCIISGNFVAKSRGRHPMITSAYRPMRNGSIAAPLRARSTGHYSVDASWNEPPNRKMFLELFWGVSGEGDFVAEDGNFRTLHPGEVTFYFPGDTHRIVPRSARWEYYWLTCDGEHLDEVIAAFRLERRPVPAGPCPQELFAQLARELCDLTAAGEFRAGATAYEIISRACIRGGEQGDPLVTAFRDIVEELFADPALSVNGIAAKLGVHRSTLARLVRKQTGYSPGEYLISRRIQEAAGLLAGTCLPVKEIAAVCGCSDPNYLAKVLRKRLGHSPTELRRGER